MLTIIHGDDITKSRQHFIEMKQQYPDAFPFDGQEITLTALTQELEGGELFSESKKIFIEQLITKKKVASEFKDIVSYLQSQAVEKTIVLWEGKELDAKTLSLFKGSIVRSFKLPQSLFTFLDSLKPGNSKLMVQLFHQTLTTMEEDAIFYMLIRHIRLLLALYQGNTAIDEIKRMQDWQKTKLIKQAKLFSALKLMTLYENLYQIESAYKTGQLSYSLTASIDILLLGV